MADIAGAVFGGIPAVGAAISAVCDLVEKLKRGEDSVEVLGSAVLQAWEIIRIVNGWQLQGYYLSNAENDAIQKLIKQCYHAEDLMDRPSSRRFWKSWEDEKLSSATKIEFLTKKWREIVDLRSIEHQLNEAVDRERPRQSVERQCQLVGRQSEMDEIVGKLNLCDGNEKYGVCIVGMTGLGKSSIARAILKSFDPNPKIVGVWIDVEDGEFVWNKISKKIPNYMQYFIKGALKLPSQMLHILWKNNTPRMGVPELSTTEQHKQTLLIVFDNLLSVDACQWDRFQEYMRRQAEKSKKVRIMITTRDPSISKRNCLIPHELELLKPEDCKEVIKGNANNGQLHDDLIEDAAKKCEGLPLVAKWLNTTISNHPDTLHGVTRLSEVPEFKEIFLRLMSPYIGISAEQRRCVAYLSLFPISHTYTIDDLVHLWEGECFVKPTQELSSLKRVENYVKDLQNRLILQSSGKLNSFGLDYATLAAWGTCQQGLPLPVNENENEIKYVRHLSLSCRDFNSQTWPRLRKSYKKLRTLLSLCPDDKNAGVGSREIPPKFCKKVKYLRVLSLKGTNIDKIPDGIEKLKRLRYFDLSFTTVKVLPKALSNLPTLKFLKLKGTENIDCVKVDFHKLTNLLHVDWDEFMLRKRGMPKDIGKLSELQNLPLFIVGTNVGYRINQLGRMNKLRGSIHIQGLENVNGTEEAQEAMLRQKHDLKEIVLEWSPQSPSCETVLQGLELCNNVKKLELKGYVGENFPNWIRNSQLEEISLKDCNCPNLFRTLAKLQWLKILTVDYMHVQLAEENCPCRSHDDTGNLFPSLESMELHNMTRLQRLTGLQEGDMPRFQRLKVVCEHHQLDASFFRGLRNPDRQVHITINGDEQ